MNRFLVPIDGSEHALRAVKYVGALGAKLRSPAEVLLLNVQHPLSMKEFVLDGRPSAGQALEARLREAAGEILDAAGAVAEKAGIKHSEHAAIGDAAKVIAEHARTHHCDEIVMSTRGLGALEGLVLGSVATKVLHHAEVPVLLLK